MLKHLQRDYPSARYPLQRNVFLEVPLFFLTYSLIFLLFFFFFFHKETITQKKNKMKLSGLVISLISVSTTVMGK